MAEPPVTICAWDPELNKYTLFDLVGEHGPYFVYESRETGRQILVLKGEVWRFADMRLCEQQG